MVTEESLINQMLKTARFQIDVYLNFFFTRVFRFFMTNKMYNWKCMIRVAYCTEL